MKLRFVLGYEGYNEYEIVGEGSRVRYQRERPSDYHVGTYNTGVWPNQIPATGAVSYAHRVGELPPPEVVDAVFDVLVQDWVDHRAAAARLDWPLTPDQQTLPDRPRPVRFDHELCCWVDENGARACQDE